MSECEYCTCHEPSGVCTEDEYSDAHKEWMKEQLGDVTVNLGKVTKPIIGYEVWCVELVFDKLDINNTLLLGAEFTQDELYEIALKLARSIKEYYVETRLFPMLEGTEVGVC